MNITIRLILTVQVGQVVNNKFKVFLNNYFKGSVNNLLFTLKKVSKFDRNSPNLENSIQSKDVWIIDSSSSFNKKSLFNNFASYLKEELSKNNLGYANIICASGPNELWISLYFRCCIR